MSDGLKGKALRMLARREHSRAELVRKLAAEGTPQEIHDMLAQLEGSGLLSDTRFAEAYVASRAARVGNARLRHDLRTRGIDEETIDAALPGGADSEAGRAREVWRRKFAAPPADRADWARQARFLQGRGFAPDIIRKVLKESAE
ncbi:MAG: recombination regulator RecX [Burkholderiales bacterium]|nr:recombination regulator RecX [Burkholderiales bacterium]